MTLGACASQTKLSPQIRARIQQDYVGSTIELRQSCYYGDLYDENEVWLLSSYPFEKTYHIVDLDGAPIHPKGERGIMPAGTKFKVVAIDFPTPGVLAKRMLTSPRYNPWVYLEVTDPQTKLDLSKKHFVVTLPMEMKTEAEAKKSLEAIFAAPGDMGRWLGRLRPSVRVAVEHKNIQKGMNKNEMHAALGAPHYWFKGRVEGKIVRIAWYPTHEVAFDEGLVISVQNPRYAKLKPAGVAFRIE